MPPTGPDNNGNARPAGYTLVDRVRYLTGESSTPPGPLPPTYPVPGRWVNLNFIPAPAKKTFTLNPEAETFARKEKKSEGKKSDERLVEEKDEKKE
jgi:hypothetical protein